MRMQFLTDKRKKESLFLVMLLLIIMLLYLKPELSANYVFDDYAFYKSSWKIKNATIKDIITKSYWNFSGDANYKKGYWRPVVILSFVLEQKIADTNSKISHLINLFLFIIIVFLFYYYLKAKNFPLKEIAVLLFVVHPLNTDNTMWIVGRCDLFPLIFFLLSVIAIEKNKNLLLYTSVAFGFLSKESFFIYSIILVFYLILKKDNDKLYKRKILILSILWSVFFIVNKFFFSDSPSKFFNFKSLNEVLLYLFGVLHYILSSIISLKNTPFIASVLSIVNISYKSLALNLFIFLLFTIFYKNKKSNEFLIFSFSTFFVFSFFLYISLLNFMPILVSKRFLQFYLVFFIPVMVLSLKKSTKVSYILYPVFLILFINWFVISKNSALKYKSNISFFKSLYEKSENDPVFLQLLSHAYFLDGNFGESLKLSKKSIPLLKKVMKKHPNYYSKLYEVKFYISHAKLLILTGKCNKALKILEGINKNTLSNDAKENYFLTFYRLQLVLENLNSEIFKNLKVSNLKNRFTLKTEFLIESQEFKKAMKLIKENEKIFPHTSSEYKEKIKKAMIVKDDPFSYHYLIGKKRTACKIGPKEESIFFSLKHAEACIEGCMLKEAYSILKRLEKKAVLKKDKKLLKIIAYTYYFRLADEKNFKRLIKEATIVR